MTVKQISLLTSLILTTGICTYCRADVTVDPIGIAVSLDLEDNDSLTTELTLSNDGESDIAFEIDLDDVEVEEEARLNRRRRGPRRDEAGDEIGSFEGINQANNFVSAAGWDWDNERMWVTSYTQSIAVAYAHNDDYDEFEEVIRIEPGRCMTGAWCMGIYYTAELGRSSVQRWDAEGEQLDSDQLDHTIYGLAADVEQELLFVLDRINNYPIHVYQLDDEGRVGDETGVIDNHLAYHNNNNARNLEWVPAHRDTGQLWINAFNNRTVYQILVDTDEWECIDSEETVSFETELTTQYDAVAHDGYNMWAAGYGPGDIRIYDDGIDESYIEWVAAFPDEGIIEADNSIEIELIFTSTEAEPGAYEAILQIELTEPEEERRDDLPALLEMSAVLTVYDDVTTIFGAVTGAGSEAPIRGARLDLDRYIYTRFADAEGGYRMADMPLGEYTVAVNAPDFLPFLEQINIENAGDFELDVALLHAECNLNLLSVVAEVDSGDSAQFEIIVTNDGTGPLAYEIVKRLPGDAGMEPWEHRLSHQVGRRVDDDLIQGVAYFNDRFWVAGGGNNLNLIYVFDRDGELQTLFPQPGDTRMGLSDLTWDGELLWGGDNDYAIYGFATDGEVITSWEGQERVNQALAWDQDRELLWITGITSNDIIGYNRDGEEQASVDQFDLRIYGLTYWSDDPDGYQLYVLSSSDQESAIVHKINLDEPDIMFVVELDHPDGGGPRGCFMTGQYDIYSQVFMAIANDGDQDRVDVWQVAGNASWIDIEPVEGTIEANESDPFTLTLHATDLPDTTFEGQLVWVHDGVGGETALDLTMEVADIDDIVADHSLPLEFGLQSVYPNPFNSRATVRFGLDCSESVTLTVHDLMGREVVTLYERAQAQAGNYRVVWNASDLPSGIYILRLRSDLRVQTTKVALVR